MTLSLGRFGSSPLELPQRLAATAGEGWNLPAQPKSLAYKAPPVALSKPPAAEKGRPYKNPPSMLPKVAKKSNLPVPHPLRETQVPTCKLRIVTCGIMDLEQAARTICGHRLPPSIAQFCRILHQQGSTYAKQINTFALLEVLQFMDVLRKGNDSVIIEDLRAADDPEHDRSLRRHLGSCPPTMKGVEKQEVTRAGLKRVRRTLWAKCSANPDRSALLTVVAFCKKGVHRSVAFAHLLRKVVGAYSKAESAASQMPIDILVQEFDMIHVSELGVNLGSHLITKNAHIPLSSTKNIFTAIRCFHGHSHCRLQFHVFHGHSTFFHGQMHTFSRPNLVFTAIS